MKLRLCNLICVLGVFFLLLGNGVLYGGDTVVVTLSNAIERALQYNEGILAAKYGVKKAEAGVTIGRAGFFPKITLQGSYTRLAELPAIEMEMPLYDTLELPVFDLTGDMIGFTYAPGIIGVETFEFPMGETKNYLARVSLQQPLFTWGKILDGYQITRFNLEAQKEDYKRAKNELTFQVTQFFYTILTLKEFLNLSREAYEQAERHLRVVERRYEAGVASKFDLLRAQVQLSNLEPQFIKSQDALEMATIGFKVLLGLPQGTAVLVIGELKYEPVEVELDELIDQALQNNPEIKALRFRKTMVERAVRVVQKTYLPDLIFSANYDYKKPLYFENEWGKDWSITVALQMPLFTGFETLGKIRQSQATLSQTKHGINFLQQSIDLEARSTWLEMEEAEKIVLSQRDNIRQAEEALRIVEERYTQGLATSLEVMDMQLARNQAKANYLQSLSTYLIAQAKIRKIRGE